MNCRHTCNHGPCSCNCSGWCCCCRRHLKTNTVVSEQTNDLYRARMLSKSDLWSQMVFFFPFISSLTRQRQDWSTVEKEADFHLLWSDVYFLQKREKKGLVNCVWHQMLSVFDVSSTTGWSVPNLVYKSFDIIVRFNWAVRLDRRWVSVEGGSRQSLFMVWQWTSQAPGDGPSQFDFHQDVNSNYTARSKTTIKRQELKRTCTGSKRVWGETRPREGEPDSVLFVSNKMHAVKVQIMVIVRSHFSLISALICWHLLGASWVRLMARASQTDVKMDFLCLD